MAGRRTPTDAGDAAGSPRANALGRARALIGTRAEPVVRSGYLDVMGESGVRRSASQIAMQSRLLPVVYEQLWRPVLFGAATIGIRERQEAALMRDLLGPVGGGAVLDVACGPGNTTRRLVDAVGPQGVVIGVDAASGMLERAVRDTPATNVAYVRADGSALPFAGGTFEGVACFGALYLVEEPFVVLDELVRVLAPGGRIAILTSCHRAPGPLRKVVDVAAFGSGFRWFGRDEITGALAERGLAEVSQTVRGVMQYVGAIKP